MSEQPEAAGPDRRAHPRSPIVVREARCICGIDVFFGYALDVSRGGMFVSTTKRRKAGEVHEIRFQIPGLDRWFECRARVVWNRGFDPATRQAPGFGVQFLDLAEEDARTLDAWVRRVGPG
ncbi:MAG: PilZ domain-containing protein [Deferrisomatales bacterium]|nr:PilZ domain-containing protein [Deferrisomatales bacterium]